MAPKPSAMTPTQAAAVLRDVGDIEERLTARANGITSMVWGITAAAIFLAYGTADPYLEDVGIPWLYSLLWAPLVAAGVALTGAVWNAHAITLRRNPETRKGLLMSGGFVLLFFGVCAGVFGLLYALADVDWNTSSLMALVNGLFAVAVAAFLRRDCRPAPLVAAGVAMAAVGLTLGLSGLHHQAATLLAALGVGLSWFLSGLYTYARG